LTQKYIQADKCTVYMQSLAKCLTILNTKSVTISGQMTKLEPF